MHIFERAPALCLPFKGIRKVLEHGNTMTCRAGDSISTSLQRDAREAERRAVSSVEPRRSAISVVLGVIDATRCTLNQTFELSRSGSSACKVGRCPLV
jgi:hypothetical protein